MKEIYLYQQVIAFCKFIPRVVQGGGLQIEFGIIIHHFITSIQQVFALAFPGTLRIPRIDETGCQKPQG
jgi:hypothetical protein